MAESYKYEKRYWYPHMKPNDVDIWERFITTYPEYFDNCEYDVPVGSIPEFDTTVHNATGGKAELLYRKKIDVVGYKNEARTIVEIKPKAGTSSIGQILGYVELYKIEYPDRPIPAAMILTDAIMTDMQMLADKFNIKLIAI